MSSSYEELMERKNFLPFRLDHLTPGMIKMAKDELNETEESRSSAIEQLRKLILKKKDLKCRTDDEFLLQFLRARKFSVKSAFKRLESFHQVICQSFADVFVHIDEETAKKAFGSGFGSHLPYRDREGAAVVFAKFSNWRVEDYDVISIFNVCAAMHLSAVDYPASQVCGLHLLIDIEGTSLQHMRCLSPRFLRLASRAMQDTLPVRFKAIHLINTSSIFRYLWKIITMFLSEKMKKRIHLHDDNVESLHKFIPKEILPAEYGGDNPDFDPIKQGSEELEKFLPKYWQIMHEGYTKK